MGKRARKKYALSRRWHGITQILICTSSPQSYGLWMLKLISGLVQMVGLVGSKRLHGSQLWMSPKETWSHPNILPLLGNNLFAQTPYISSSIFEVLWEVRINPWKTDPLQVGLPTTCCPPTKLLGIQSRAVLWKSALVNFKARGTVSWSHQSKSWGNEFCY